jgi:glucose-6-phosphate isomerase
MIPPGRIAGVWDPERGVIEGCPLATKRLSQIRECFADQRACDEILRHEDPVIYTVSTFDLATGPGQLHCGLGVLFPGRVGEEYYLTRGHYHATREASEIYLGLRGSGVMLLQGEDGTVTTANLVPQGYVYIPARTAHRTVNTGSEKLVYCGIYPANAGHDYDAVRKENFRTVVVSRNGAPVVLSRSGYNIPSAPDRTP